MRRIPDILLNTRSSAEARLFDTLANVDLGHGWTAFHSLNCSEHEYKQWSEIDFLLLGPAGIYVLEVKGGGVGYQNGVWQYVDRFGRTHEHLEGPFEQAKSARFSLERLLVERFDLRSHKVYPRFGFGVLFPDCPWNVATPEMPRDLVADHDQCLSPVRLREALRKIVAYWSAKLHQTMPLGCHELAAIRNIIRPNVDVYPPFTVQLGHTVRELQNLTQEQYVLLDVLEANPRAIVSGGAGTGKTFLLLQSARREAAEGNDVLVVTESEILAAHIRNLEPDHRIQIVALRNLSQLPANAFDVLFVDEGQDLLSFDKLVAFGEYLRGGMENGRWRWFMDENNQSHLSGEFDGDALKYLLEGLGGKAPLRLPLTRNVRNSRPIVEAVEHWTGSEIGAARADRFGAPPTELEVRSDDDLVAAVERRLAELADLDVPFEDVGIVASQEAKALLLESLSRRWKRKCLPLDITTIRASLAGKILIGTSSEFKGLERPVEMVVDLDSGPSAPELAAFYVATTRANYDLTVIRRARRVDA